MSAAVRIGLPRFVFYFSPCFGFVFFFFNGGKNVLFKGCSCILSPSKLIGLENVLAHSPGLIGIKHKHMEWRRSHCWINRRYKSPANVITLGKGVCFCKCVQVPGLLCAHGRRSALSKQGQWKPVISFRTGRHQHLIFLTS